MQSLGPIELDSLSGHPLMATGSASSASSLPQNSFLSTSNISPSTSSSNITLSSAFQGLNKEQPTLITRNRVLRQTSTNTQQLIAPLWYLLPVLMNGLSLKKDNINHFASLISERIPTRHQNNNNNNKPESEPNPFSVQNYTGTKILLAMVIYYLY